MKYRNAKRNIYGTIDVEIEHPKYGWIPFTASPNDPEAHGRAIYAEVESKGNPEPYTGKPLQEVEAEREQARADAEMQRQKKEREVEDLKEELRVLKEAVTRHENDIEEVKMGRKDEIPTTRE